MSWNGMIHHKTKMAGIFQDIFTNKVNVRQLGRKTIQKELNELKELLDDDDKSPKANFTDEEIKEADELVRKVLSKEDPKTWKRLKLARELIQEVVDEAEDMLDNDDVFLSTRWKGYLEIKAKYDADMNIDVDSFMESWLGFPKVEQDENCGTRLGTCTETIIRCSFKDGTTLFWSKRNYHYKHAEGEWELLVDGEDVSIPREPKPDMKPWEIFAILLEIDLEDIESTGAFSFPEEE